MPVTEIWKDIPGFDGKYLASNLGRIKRKAYTIEFERTWKKHERIMSQLPEKTLVGKKLSKKGYQRIQLEKKTYVVHRLIALTFIPNPDNKPQINHIDGNKTNNSVENLEWVTNQENRDHAVKHNFHPNRSNGFAKVTLDQVEEIKFLIENGITQKEIGKKYGVCQQTISYIFSPSRLKNS